MVRFLCIVNPCIDICPSSFYSFRFVYFTCLNSVRVLAAFGFLIDHHSMAGVDGLRSLSFGLIASLPSFAIVFHCLWALFSVSGSFVFMHIPTAGMLLPFPHDISSPRVSDWSKTLCAPVYAGDRPQ